MANYTIGAKRRGRVVGVGRFELPTSRLSGVRSNQLSYTPINDQRTKFARRLRFGLVE